MPKQQEKPSVFSRVKQTFLAICFAIVLVSFVIYGINTIYEPPKYEDYCNTQEYRQYFSEGDCLSVGGKWYDVPKESCPPSECPGSCSHKLGVMSDECAVVGGTLLGEKCVLNYVASASVCGSYGGSWSPIKGISCPEPKCFGNCDAQYTCNMNYNAVREKWNRNVFFVALIIGLILLFVGLNVTLPSVSGGIISGATVIVGYGIVNYWGELGKYWRLALLGALLALLVWIAYKKLRK